MAHVITLGMDLTIQNWVDHAGWGYALGLGDHQWLGITYTYVSCTVDRVTLSLL
jgi:hypothetical protein